MESLTATQVAAITDDLIVSAVGDDHRLVDANDVWKTSLGWAKEDLLGSRLQKFVAPGDRGRAVEALRRLSGNGDVSELRLDMVGPSGLRAVSWRFCCHEGNLYGVGKVGGSDALESRVEKVLERHEQKEDELEDAVATASMAEKRARTWKTWLAAAVLAVSAVGGALAWAIDKIESSVRQAHESEQREEKVDGEIKTLENRADKTDKKFQRVGGVLIETQVQVSDSIGYIVSMIEAVHPGATAGVDEPEAVDLARKKVEAIKEKELIDKLFEFDEAAPDDPFAGIENEPEEAGTGTDEGS